MSRWPERGGVTDLIGAFEIFLIDQFGTMHDGDTLYAGVLDAMRALRMAGARVALLSNSGRRAEANVRRLAGMGITDDLYELCVTSGEVAWRMLKAGDVPALRGARRCLLLERGGDAAATLRGLDLEPVQDAGRADLVFIAGSEGDQRGLDSYEAVLTPAARAGLPCLCTNPDRTMVTPKGLAFGSGRIAELYEQLGGTVTWIGKPHAAVYDFTLGVMCVTDRAGAVGIGDSIEHDIAGAHAAGCCGWMVRNGIMAGADDDAIEAECRRVGDRPDGVLGGF